MLSDGNPIPVVQYHALLRMLIKRATFMDKWRARKLPGYWLNMARRELLIHNATNTPRYF